MEEAERGGCNMGKNRKAAQPGLLCLLLVWMFLLSAGTYAAPEKAGWQTEGNNICYYINASSGLVRAAGLRQIGDGFFYFKSDGSLQTGWVKTADGYRYFEPEGEVGTRGKMYTGLHKISRKRYHFDEKGVLSTGFCELTQGSYFFRKAGAAGVIGSAVTKAWVRCAGAKRYFDSKGKMVKNSWVGDFYVGSDGARLVSAITPDGYIVGSTGRKVGRLSTSGWTKVKGRYYYYNGKTKKLARSKFKTIDGKTYYFDENGIRVKGWKIIGNYKYYFNSKGERQTGKVTIRGRDYYFNAKGHLQVSRTVDGYTTDENGVIISGNGSAGKKKVLIVAGHGQGDPGAVSSLGTEYRLTREFAKMIVDRLSKNGKISVDYYKNGSTGYDMYQRNKAALGSLTSGITGSGSAKKNVKKALDATSTVPKLWEYDYVMEVHFNAAVAKDEKGNGVRKGFGIYINSNKPAGSRTIDNRIVRNMQKAGSAIWGGGVVESSTLLNARVCNELGVNYSLIETAFIDDKDDMKFYSSKKGKMAKAVASAIVSSLAG